MNLFIPQQFFRFMGLPGHNFNAINLKFVKIAGLTIAIVYSIVNSNGRYQILQPSHPH